MAVDPVGFGIAGGAGGAGVGGVGGVGGTKSVGGPLPTESVGSTSFGEMLDTALGEVEKMQDHADQTIKKVASGDLTDIHQVMVAFEQARLSMQMMIEVRNRLVEAYQDVSRMPL